MAKHPSRPYPLIEQIMALLVLAVILLYTYGLFVRLPYLGFEWDSATGRVRRPFVTAELQAADQILQIGPVAVADFQADLRRTVLENVQPGEIIPLVVQRDGQTFTLQWVIPGFNRAEFDDRLFTQWWLALLFWASGQTTLLLLRPRDTRWHLLIAFNFVTALWLGASNLSRWHLWDSALVLRAVMWLWVPIYWHLHWVFPKPLGRMPILAWRLIYLAALALAGAEWLQFTPKSFYALGFLLALFGTLGLLLARYVRQPDQRRNTGLLFTAGALALVPPALLSLIYVLLNISYRVAAFAFLFFPILPLGYFYAAYRRQLGGLELRANRLISVYLFLLLLSLLFGILVPAVDAALAFPGEEPIIAFGVATLAVILALFGFAPFQNSIEHRLLHISLPPARLIETYTARITTSLDLPGLIRLLTHEVLPSLLVRQSALLHFETPGRAAALYQSGVDDKDLPTERDSSALLAEAGRYRLPPATTGEPQPCPWVRLALPLRLGEQTIGLWLLGRRDPDDFYSQEEIPLFQTLANQTAIALSYILQAERLRVLYRANIDQAEVERTHLARELHDDVLNRLAALKTGPESNAFSPKLFGELDAVIARIRQTIGGLRPASLDYGLRPAFEQLADTVADRAGHSLKVRVDLPPSDVRYDPRAEQHLFRIAQEACENVRLHARARTLCMQGWLDEKDVALTVEDDGVGFATGNPSGLTGLLAHLINQKHFGLAGMVERAALIGAELSIDSAPGRGTRVRVHWSPNSQSNQ